MSAPIVVSPLIAATYPPTTPETCCRRHAWCLRAEHEGPCVVVEQRAMPEPESGPIAATRRRWGR